MLASTDRIHENKMIRFSKGTGISMVGLPAEKAIYVTDNVLVSTVRTGGDKLVGYSKGTGRG